MLPYSKQYVDKNDIKLVAKILKSKFLTRGKIIKKFEKKICEYTGSKYAIAVSNASAGLHISCMSSGLKKNDILWTVPNTFVASASCALHCNAKIDFVDIDQETSNISIEKLEKKLKFSKKRNRLPKILIPVHFAGQPTDQKKINFLSKKYGFKIIEDASHSLGASYKKEKVGSCKWSDISVFSFHPVKPITTAEGGVITTNSKKNYEILTKLRDHGISRDYKKLKIKSGWYYEQQLLGFNYRMNEIQAALGLSQLRKLDNFVRFRNRLARNYFKRLKGLPIKLPKIEKFNYSTFHLFVIKLDLKKRKFLYDKIYKKLINSGLGVNLHYLPVHFHPIFKKLGFKTGDFPNAEKHAKSAISIPIFHKMTDAQQKKVIKILNKILLKKYEVL